MISNKRWFIHYFSQIDRKWRKCFRMCLTYAEASYNMELLQRADKFSGTCTTYRIVCISIKPLTKRQLELF